MDDEIETVSEVKPGYRTFESEAEERHEAREYFRRRILRGIRGHLRENKRFRWWLVAVQAECALLACLIAGWLYDFLPHSTLLAPAVGIFATWPFYVLSMRLRAKSEVRNLHLKGHWETLKRAGRNGRGQRPGHH